MLTLKIKHIAGYQWVKMTVHKVQVVHLISRKNKFTQDIVSHGVQLKDHLLREFGALRLVFVEYGVGDW